MIAKHEIIPLTVPRHVTVNRVIFKKLSLTVIFRLLSVGKRMTDTNKLLDQR